MNVVEDLVDGIQKKREEIRRDINNKRTALSVVNNVGDAINWKHIGMLEEKLVSALEVEERYGRQREKVEWIQKRDKTPRLKRMKVMKGYMALKLDMSKAYDRVEWCFIEQLMLKMEFPDIWVRLIMGCVSTVTYSFKLNGEIVGKFRPTKGLRQWDLLSPYLFILCVEGLSSLIKEAQIHGDISGFKCSMRGPAITHLFFTDNSLLFSKANERNCREVNKVLKTYSCVSGQVINFHKLAMCFSPSISNSSGDRLASLVGVNKVDCHETYLGLPCFSGRNKRRLFSTIVDRVWYKIKGWG
ncbi:hypothetical protein Ddye_029090 [Dipteronia dyeriana]|uniref:Reverse transcriptase domain-containing protein n=1 Tax=Dipteronia dyeriana TaxID=168575 RepID=A0AAD9TEX7_9ROSI|nr:hypothetical protein Ddye_029090 [Dipteronia dyeriana]